MTKLELKPCPFCGSKDVKHYFDSQNENWISCLHCFCRTDVMPTKQEAVKRWNHRPEPEKPKVKVIPLSSLKDSDYVWIMAGRCGVYQTVEKAKKACPDWNVTAFLCEIDTPVINFDTFDQRIFDLVDDSESQGYIGNGEGDYPYYGPETVKQMYDVLMAGIREKGQFVKPTNIQVVKD